MLGTFFMNDSGISCFEVATGMFAGALSFSTSFLIVL